jgi:hypothetical protein
MWMSPFNGLWMDGKGNWIGSDLLSPSTNRSGLIGWRTMSKSLKLQMKIISCTSPRDNVGQNPTFQPPTEKIRLELLRMYQCTATRPQHQQGCEQEPQAKGEFHTRSQ